MGKSKMDFDKLASVVALLTGPQGLSPQEMLTAFAVELMEMDSQEGQEYVEELRASAASVRAAIKAEAEACECSECAAERFDTERSREVSTVQSAMALAVRAGAFSRKGEA
jgi:hypothetical protein